MQISNCTENSGKGTASFLEWVFVSIMSVTIFASSWLLGCIYTWAQWTMLGLCGMSLLCAILIFLTSRNPRQIDLPPWNGWWITSLSMAAFVGFVAIQSINISNIPEIKMNDCVLTPQPHNVFLPSSIGGPFDGIFHRPGSLENASRYLLIYGAAMAGGLALILGANSRFCIRVLTSALVIHGVISALICLVYPLTGSAKVLWIKSEPLSWMPGAFFFNKNQNAAYQTLLTVWILRWSFQRSAIRRQLWFPALFLFLGAELALASVRSRAAVLFAAILACVWLFYQRAALARWWQTCKLRTTIGLAAVALLTGGVLWQAGAMRTIVRFGDESDLLRVGLHGGKYRLLLHQIALKMFEDRPYYGWGAAAYFYCYASYESAVPEMALNRPGTSYYLLNGHADGDWFEFLSEFGIVGTALFLMIWIPCLILWWQRKIWNEPVLLTPCLGVVFILWQGSIEVVFRNVGLLFLLIATAILATKLVLHRSVDNHTSMPLLER